ncbi:unnamed protein product [Dicrocoelium dendriticum]|nr:unnamed protein product [Dicrocoelium dendriticum]
MHSCTASGETADPPLGATKSVTVANVTPLLVHESDIVGDFSFSVSTTEAEPKRSFFTQDSCGTNTSTPQPVFTPRVSVNFHSTHKRTLSDDEDDRVPSHPQASPILRPTLRPVSMYATVLSDTPKEHTRGISPLPPRKRLQTTECYIKGGAPTNELQNHDTNTVSKLPTDSKTGNHEDEPELKSVADRASVFGAVLHSPKPAPPSPPSATEVRRRNMEQSETTANNRTSRVFTLVKNFEQTC